MQDSEEREMAHDLMGIAAPQVAVPTNDRIAWNAIQQINVFITKGDVLDSVTAFLRVGRHVVILR
jgi:hypothetical protein